MIKQDEGDDVVGDRVEAHRHHAEKLERPALAVIAAEPAEQIAEHPGEQRAGEKEADRPGQRAADQRRDRRRERRERRPEIKDEYAAPIDEVLFDQAAFDAVELLQGLAHHQHRLGAGVAEGGHRGDHLLDRIDRRQMRDEEGQRYADEDDQQELRQPLGDVDAVASHRAGHVWRGGAAGRPACQSTVATAAAGFSLTIM